MKLPRDAGELRRRIAFDEKTDVRDPETGVVAEQWVEAFEVWGKIEPISRREFGSENKQNSESMVRVWIWYREGLDCDRHRIRFTQAPNASPVIFQTFDILPPFDPDGSRTWLAIEGRQIK